jgi:hypothetical protein
MLEIPFELEPETTMERLVELESDTTMGMMKL